MSTPVTGSDVFTWPLLGPALRWRHARTALQLLLLAVAVVLVAHGLAGPQLAPANLSTVLTWVHYRGLLVVALLAAGNLFCTGCPFILVRDAARRLHAPRARWPRWLRRKWPAIVLFVGVLFVYELFDLWSLPAATAWLVLGYFAAALALDVVFAGASFCKYVCPIGQFNFITSTLSPLEVRVRDHGTCRSCQTVDCIKGRRATDFVEAGLEARPAPLRVVRRGCELGLFLPAKVGNLDCTLCFDCVQACPHDNIGLVTRTPGLELADDHRRSGIGRLAQRRDLMALVVVFVFGGLVNALGMIAPVRALELWLAGVLGITAEGPVLAVLFAVALVVAPTVLLGGAAWWTSAATGAPAGRQIGAFVYALVPVGAGVWAAHYGFHLLTGLFTLVPVTQSAAIDLFGRAWLGTPVWTWVGLQPGTVFPIQIGLVSLGTIGSIGVAWLVAEREHPRRTGAAMLPWAVLTLILGAIGIWMLGQPMDMRAVGVLG
jgi:ferredoxin